MTQRPIWCRQSSLAWASRKQCRAGHDRFETAQAPEHAIAFARRPAHRAQGHKTKRLTETHSLAVRAWIAEASIAKAFGIATFLSRPF